MKKKIIRVTIDKVGNPTITAEGFSGSECTTATESLIDRFQGRDAELTVEESDEMYQSGTEDQTLTI